MTGPVVLACVVAPLWADPDQELAGQFLVAYDPEANMGRGEAEWTRDPAKALEFGSMREAFACLTQVPQARPVRPDGKPNRPLTALTMSAGPPP